MKGYLGTHSTSPPNGAGIRSAFRRGARLATAPEMPVLGTGRGGEGDRREWSGAWGMYTDLPAR